MIEENVELVKQRRRYCWRREFDKLLYKWTGTSPEPDKTLMEIEQLIAEIIEQKRKRYEK